MKRTLARAMCASALAVLLAVGASADTIYLKNGSVIRGTVVGFSNGEFTVQMAGGSRSRASLATDDIERIEFDANGAASNGSQPPDPQPEPATYPSDSSPQPVEASDTGSVDTGNAQAPGPRQGEWDVLVDPKSDWTNSRVRLERGTSVRVTASGTVQIDAAGKRAVGPAGSDFPDRDKLVPGRPTGALIAVVGDDNDDFIYIGTQAQFVTERSGYLFLSVNEGYLRDNSGSFRAHISVDPSGATPSSVANNTARTTGGIHGGTTPPPVAANPRPAQTNTPRRNDPVTSSIPSSTGKVLREADISVVPNIDWTNTKIRVMRGNIVRIKATGTVQLGGGRTAGPAGIATDDTGKLIPDQPTGGLVAVIGDDNDDFVYVGPSSTFVSEREGMLFLSVNEGNLKDNSGTFSAHVAIEAATDVAAQPAQKPAPAPAPSGAKGGGNSLPAPIADNGGAPAPKPKPAAPSIGPNGGQTSVTIQAKSDWTSTGIVVKKGQKIRMTASGSAKIDAAGRTVTPAGVDAADPHKLLPAKPTGALIAVIGDDNSEYIFIGAGTEFTVQRDGILFLGLNEGEVMDNSGLFTVQITVTPAKK